MWWQERLSDFVTLLVVINPLAAVPIFLAATNGLDEKHHRTLGLHAVLVSFGVLIFFIVAGSFLLKHMGIAIRSFQIAGGIVLYLVQPKAEKPQEAMYLVPSVAPDSAGFVLGGSF